MVSNGLVVRYESQEFADLLNEHIKGLNAPSSRVLYTDIAQIVGRSPNTMKGDMAKYRDGNLLGQTEFLTPNSVKSLEQRISNLQDLLWTLGVPEDSRMIEIIREVTRKYIQYPPPHITTHVSYSTQTAQTIEASL